MFCTNCGKEIPDGSKFCSFCGHQFKGTLGDDINKGMVDITNKVDAEFNSSIDEIKKEFRGANAGYGAKQKLKTDRGLLSYILLNIVTCGIYGYYFIYTIAKDLNEVCEGDGEVTGGLGSYILFSILTCGIYSWYWEYKLANRIQVNAGRYGFSVVENGTTVLMWNIFGTLLCFIGPFIAMNIIIKNTNAICAAYNRKNNLY